MRACVPFASGAAPSNIAFFLSNLMKTGNEMGRIEGGGEVITLCGNRRVGFPKK